MFEILRIKVFGHQPVARVRDEMLDRIIQRDYGDLAIEVRQKLERVVSDDLDGRNRISAAILKLANGDLDAIDRFVVISNNDFRDVLAPAEYPRYSKVGFGNISKGEKKKLYVSDWKEYISWLNKV